MTEGGSFNYRDVATRHISCPLCNSTQATELAIADRYRMGVRTVGCNGCGLIMTNPQPTEAAMANFYAHHYRRFYQSTHAPDVDYIKRYRKDLRAGVLAQFVAQRYGERRRLRVLDLGCAEGSTLKALNDVLTDPVLAGVEPDPGFARFAADYAGARIHASIDALEGEVFDLVIVNHVLEHITDPVAYLRAVRNLLAADGEVYVAVPDAAAYTSIADLHIAHLYHFTNTTLAATAQKSGFKVKALETYTSPYHPDSIRTVLEAADAAPEARDLHADKSAWPAVQRAGRRSRLYFLKRNPALRRIASPLLALHRHLRSSA